MASAATGHLEQTLPSGQLIQGQSPHLQREKNKPVHKQKPYLKHHGEQQNSSFSSVIFPDKQNSDHP